MRLGRRDWGRRWSRCFLLSSKTPGCFLPRPCKPAIHREVRQQCIHQRVDGICQGKEHAAGVSQGG